MIIADSATAGSAKPAAARPAVATLQARRRGGGKPFIRTADQPSLGTGTAGANSISAAASIAIVTSSVFEVQQHRSAEDYADAGRCPRGQQYRNFCGNAERKDDVGEEMQQKSCRRAA